MTGCQSGNRSGERLVIVDQSFADAEVSPQLQTTSSSVEIYPNPAKGVLNVRVESSTSDETQFIITDLSGRLIRRSVRDIVAGTAVQTFELNKLKAGIYILHIVRAEERISKKFVVMP